jgi:hypothetical protein
MITSIPFISIEDFNLLGYSFAFNKGKLMSIQSALPSQIALGRELLYKISKEKPSEVSKVAQKFFDRQKTWALFRNGASSIQLLGFAGYESSKKDDSESWDSYHKRMTSTELYFEKSWVQILANDIAELTTKNDEYYKAIQCFLTEKANPKLEPLPFAFNVARLEKFVRKLRDDKILSSAEKQEKITRKKIAKEAAIEKARIEAEEKQKAAKIRADYEKTDKFKLEILEKNYGAVLIEYKDLLTRASPNVTIDEEKAQRLTTDAEGTFYSHSPYLGALIEFIKKEIGGNRKRSFDSEPDSLNLDMIQKPYTWENLTLNMKNFIENLSNFLSNNARMSSTYRQLISLQTQIKTYNKDAKFDPIPKPPNKEVEAVDAAAKQAKEKADQNVPADQVDNTQPPSRVEPKKPVIVQNEALDTTKTKVEDVQQTTEIEPTQKSDSNVQDASKTDSKKELKDSKAKETSAFWSLCSWFCSLPTRLFNAIKRLFS